ncbi:MAG TPA: spore germination protein [Bacillus sp. (in: firmicutes)]|nr:spore germination protein [Bacillus sp. (in: firmicutes)]
MHEYKIDHSTLEAALSESLEKNISDLKETFESCEDIDFYETEIRNVKVCLVHQTNKKSGKEIFDIEQVLATYKDSDFSLESKAEVTAFFDQCFPFRGLKKITNINDIVDKVLNSQTVLLVDGLSNALLFHSGEFIGRSVSEPTNERTVRGPQVGFVEDIDVNLQLIRKRIKTPSLKVEYLIVGKQTKTKVALVYLKGITDDDIVKEVHRRISQIQIDGILDSHYIESMIQDSRMSPFPTIYSTERPDRVCASLLDGKVAIITDGTPYALTAPALFVEFLHSGDDYYNGSLISTAVRWIRFLGLFVTLILPAFYVAMTSFHQDLLQTPFLIRIAAVRQGLPYPVLIEAIFMFLTFELIREASLRMPRTFGNATLTILGLVLIGQAAVQSGLIGPVMAIVVSVTALTSFILPNYAFHQIIRLCGIPLLLLAGLFGFMGIIVGLMFGLTHLVSLRSFGVPYFSPVSPAQKEGWKDVFIRTPWWTMETRPPGLGVKNFTRAGENIQPKVKDPFIEENQGDKNE